MSKEKTPKVVWVNEDYFGDGSESDQAKQAALNNLVSRIQLEFPQREILVCPASEQATQLLLYHQGQKVVEPPNDWYQDSWDDVASKDGNDDDQLQ